MTIYFIIYSLFELFPEKRLALNANFRLVCASLHQVTSEVLVRYGWMLKPILNLKIMRALRRPNSPLGENLGRTCKTGGSEVRPRLRPTFLVGTHPIQPVDN